MKTYTLYSLFNGEESFLQMARDDQSLKTSRTKITRWASEMGVSFVPKETLLVIKEDDCPKWQADMRAPRLSWRPYEEPHSKTDDLVP